VQLGDRDLLGTSLKGGYGAHMDGAQAGTLVGVIVGGLLGGGAQILKDWITARRTRKDVLRQAVFAFVDSFHVTVDHLSALAFDFAEKHDEDGLSRLGNRVDLTDAGLADLAAKKDRCILLDREGKLGELVRAAYQAAAPPPREKWGDYAIIGAKRAFEALDEVVVYARQNLH